MFVRHSSLNNSNRPRGLTALIIAASVALGVLTPHDSRRGRHRRSGDQRHGHH